MESSKEIIIDLIWIDNAEHARDIVDVMLFLKV